MPQHGPPGDPHGLNLGAAGNRIRLGVPEEEYRARLASLGPVLRAMGLLQAPEQDRFTGQLVAMEQGRPESLVSAFNTAAVPINTTLNPFEAGQDPEEAERVAQAGDRGRAFGAERRRLIEKTDRERREQTGGRGFLAGLFGR